jgi:hypothetical protein
MGLPAGYQPENEQRQGWSLKAKAARGCFLDKPRGGGRGPASLTIFLQPSLHPFRNERRSGTFSCALPVGWVRA